MKTTRYPLPSSSSRAFTLVELLVSLAVLSILLLINAQVIGQVQSTWSASNARVSQFREARTAFDIITRNLSQATLNTYLDYETNYLATAAATSGTAAATGPGSYVRRSDLQFICGDTTNLLPNAGGADTLPGARHLLSGTSRRYPKPELCRTGSAALLQRLLCAVLIR